MGRFYKKPKKVAATCAPKGRSLPQAASRGARRQTPEGGTPEGTTPEGGTPTGPGTTHKRITHACAQILDLLMLQSFPPLQAALCPPNPPRKSWPHLMQVGSRKNRANVEGEEMLGAR